MRNKILALDLGVGSIGWALVSLPENYSPGSSEDGETEIIAMGTRIIPLDSADEKNKFEQGRAIEVNQKRTTKRQMRRGYHRYKMRRISLKNALQTANMFDESLLTTEKLSKIELWELRAKATTEQISLVELGRVILHLNQKRGYNQNIKGQVEDTSTKDTKKNSEETTDTTEETTKNKSSKKEGYTDKIDRNSKELQGKTIGQKVYEELCHNPDYRTKDTVYYRTDYQHEFKRIMDTQKVFYPNVLTDEFIQKLYNIIYHQRPLKSQKGLVKLCPSTEKFIKQNNTDKVIKIGAKVAPKSSPLAEYKKILEAVNNIEIKEFEKLTQEGETTENTDAKETKKKTRVKIVAKRLLNTEEQKKLIDALQSCEKMSRAEILKLLGYSSQRYTLNVEKVEGNKTRTKLIDILGEDNPLLNFNLKKISRTVINTETGEITEAEQISPDVEKEPFYQLWHIIYSIKNIEECKNALIKRFNFDEETAQKLAKIEFTKGNSDFTNMSAKVMRHIIPYLEQGLMYNEAMEKAGYKHSKESRTKEEIQKRELKDALDLIPRNALRQPVVEKILNQMIHLVNEIINPERGWITKEERENGTFKIHIELARELKSGIEERKKIHEFNQKRTKDNENIAKYLTEKGITRSRNNIIRYRLFRGVNVDEKNKKMHAICLYSGKIFELNQVFDDKVVDKDHIIPQSIYPDDSQGNLVLVYKDENKIKSNKTAYDYMYSKGIPVFEQYLQRIQYAFDSGAITGTQVRNLLTTLENNPNSEPHQNIEIKGKGKKGEYAIKVTKLDEEKGFANRDMRETSYITREARRILQDICKDVLSTTGSVTAELRNLWGYNDILPQWHIERLRELKLDNMIEKKVIHDENNQETYKETIKDWSKRDDHRHHAIDALVVACTTRSIIQRINTLHAKETKDELKKELPENEAKKAENNNRMTLLRKWLVKQSIFPHHKVKEKVENILISYKPGKKVATWNKNKKAGKWDASLKRTLTPRGALHEESYYGRITTFQLNIKNINKIVEYLTPEKQKLISRKDRKAIFNDNKVQYYIANDTKGLVKYLKNTKKIEKIAVYEPKQKYVMRYSVTGINKKDVKKEDDFVDKKVYQLLKSAFPETAKDSDTLKSDISIYIKNLKQKIIRAVRMRTGDANDANSAYYPVRYNEKGEPITFVRPGNNHHIAIYTDKNGNLQEHICTFWHAVERKKYGFSTLITDPQAVHSNLIEKTDIPQSFIERLPNPEWKYVLSIQQNEMFIVGMDITQIKNAIQSKNYRLLTKNLYRVQKLSLGEYVFRHHLSTRVDDKKSEYIKTQGKTVSSIGALQKVNPIKVRINRLGEITEILEYLPHNTKL
jgi:CRISPR-associated endonuclease Csn1